MSVRVSFQGILFDTEYKRAEIRKAVDDVLSYGVDVIAQRSPVKTGLLQDSWEHRELDIFNDVFYTIFQEEGTRYIQPKHMVKNSLPEIEEYLLSRLIRFLG